MRSTRDSVTYPMAALIAMTARMAAPSTRPPVAMDTMAAPPSSSMGSEPTCSQMISSADLVVGTGRRFGPAARSRRAASSAVSPTAGLSFRERNTAAGVSVCQAGPSSDGGSCSARSAAGVVFPSRAVPRRFAGHLSPQLGQPEPTAVEQHQHVARERAGPDAMDAIVRGEPVLKLKREAGLVAQAGNAQACATTHRSGQNAHPRHIGEGHLSREAGGTGGWTSEAGGAGADRVRCIPRTLPRVHDKRVTRTLRFDDDGSHRIVTGPSSSRNGAAIRSAARGDEHEGTIGPARVDPGKTDHDDRPDLDPRRHLRCLSILSPAGATALTVYPVDRAEILAGSRFDLKVEFDGVIAEGDARVTVNGKDHAALFGRAAQFSAREAQVEASALILRGVTLDGPGTYTVVATDGKITRTVTWEVYGTGPRKARNAILFIGDGISLGHRTAARILGKGITEGKYHGRLAMDSMPRMALVGTAGVDSVITDSANSASAYTTGHKSSVNALGVYADRTPDSLDDPRVETITSSSSGGWAWRSAW